MSIALVSLAIVSVATLGRSAGDFFNTPSAHSKRIQGETPALREGERLEVALGAEDGLLEGRGSSRTFAYTASVGGTLHVWATSSEIDAFVRVEDGAGAMLAEDDDAGGGSAAYVALPVEKGAALRVVLASASPDELGRALLCLVASPETEVTRAAAEKALAELAQVEKLRESISFEEARARVALAADELLAVEGASTSAQVADAAGRIGYEAFALDALLPARAAWGAWRAQGERTLPGDHPDLQKARGNFALTMGALGDLAGARALQEQVLEICTRTLPDDHLQLQKVRLNLGNTIFDQGDLAAARTLYEKVLEVFSRTLPDDDYFLQAARENVAITMRKLGDLAGARTLQDKVLEVRSRKLPDDDPDLQAARQNLAITLREQGDLDGARALEEKVLEVRSRKLPDDDPDLQAARQNLAATMREQSDLAGARTLFEKVLEVHSRKLSEDHPDLQTARLNVAVTIQAQGDLTGARTLLEEVVEVFSRTLPDDHPDSRTARLNLVGILGRLGDFEALSPLAVSFAEGVRRAIGQLAPREVEARAALESKLTALVLQAAKTLNATPSGADLQGHAFELIETIRGASRTSSRLLAESRADPSLAHLRDEARARAREIAGIVQAGSGRDALAAAILRRDEAQRALLERIGRSDAAPGLFAAPTAEALATALNDGDAFVGYWRATSWVESDAEPDAPASAVASLLAHVVRPDGELTRVDLGPLEPIESAVAEWRDRLAASPPRGLGISELDERASELRSSGEAVRRLVFDPLLPALGDARRLIVALDDVLHAIPLDALPLDAGLVGERFSIEGRQTLQELLWKEGPLEGERTLVALGGASFDGEPLALGADELALLEPEPSGAPVVASLLRGGAWERGFKPLTHTGLEAHGIAALFAEAFEDSGRAFVLEKRVASREALEEIAPRARYVHLATHGWFAPESLRSWSDPGPLDERSGLGPRLSAEEQVIGASPMVLTGLALAGANLPANAIGRYPGLVTAEEIASWDLSGCELAVLSACDTNVGVRRAGQGVASLQKALHMAGARSVITSLWKVPDEATKVLMLEFYRRIWIERQPKAEALWAAKMWLRSLTASDLRMFGEGNEQTEVSRDHGPPVEAASPSTPREVRSFESPRYWAAWVLSGDPE